MKTRLSIVPALAVAASALPLSGALAADYDPPIYVDQAPEYTPVEVGSGWYLRGDIAYVPEQNSRHVDFGTLNVTLHEDEDPVFASIGFGYHFDNYFRAELNLGYIPGNETSGTFDDGNVSAYGSVRNHAWTGMLNGYVDLGTYVGITPYVGAGIGVYQSNRTANVNYSNAADPTQDFVYHDKKTQYSLAYTLNAGLAYQISKNVSVDLGYQYLSAPDAEVAVARNTVPYAAIDKGADYHQIKLGLRYDLW